MAVGMQYFKYRIAREMKGDKWKSVVNTFGVLFPEPPRARQFRNFLVVWLLVWMCSMGAYMLFGIAHIQK
jgi:hypothetical protein